MHVDGIGCGDRGTCQSARRDHERLPYQMAQSSRQGVDFADRTNPLRIGCQGAGPGRSAYGGPVEVSPTLYISTVGTGISYSMVLDGQPYAGANGHALMVGSGALTSECETCGAVQEQVLEHFAAGPSLVTRYNQRSGASLKEGEEVTAAAARGDQIARDILLSAGAALGNSVGFLINVLDPQAVIVGGGLGLAGGLYWESFVTSTRRHIWSEVSRDLPILRAELGRDAGVIGAAASIWKYNLQNRA